jgi:hypothetical protein
MKQVLWVFLAVGGALGALGASGSSGDDEIHPCKDATGNVVYQIDPCVEPRPVASPVAKPARKRTIEPPKASRAAVLAPPAPPVRWIPEAPLRSPARSDGSIVRTWQAFVDAVNAGDSAAALACLTPAAAKDLTSAGGGFPTRSLRDVVRGPIRVVDEGEVGPFWSLRLVRADLRPKWVLFERTEAGWKISAL